MKLLKYLLIIFVLICSNIAYSCTMADSYWQELDTKTIASKPRAYALSDALYILRNKCEKEMLACNLATGPIFITGVFYNGVSAKNDNELYEEAKLAAEIIWPNVVIASSSEMPNGPEDYEQIDLLAKKYSQGFTVTLNCENAKETIMNFIDINPQFYEYLKFVYREELKVNIRVADSSCIPIYLDEINVSPTVIIQPYLSPIGGYIYIFEKNNTISLQVSFGTFGNEGEEHHMILTYGMNQETKLPPYDAMKSDLQKEVEEKQKQFENLEFYKKIMMANDELIEEAEEYEKWIQEQENIKNKETKQVKENNADQLMFAIKNLDINMLSDFLDNDNSGVNELAENGFTPLQAACKSSLAEMVKVILAKGGNPKVVSNDGKTALHHAVDIGTLCLQSPGGDETIKACPLSIPELLINAGADVNAKDVNGKTPLHYAVHNGLVGVVSSLIKVGAEVNVQDNNGNTPMHNFGKAMSAGCVQVLLHQGANLDIKNKDGLTPYEKAMKEANAKVVNAINEYKEEIDKK